MKLPNDMPTNSSSKNIDNLASIESFKEIIDTISYHLKKEDLQVWPYFDPNLIHFFQLSPENKKQAIKDAKGYLYTLEQATQRSWSLKDDHKMLWIALKFFGLRPTSDLFQYFNENSQYAIEVYNLQNIQIWRNLKCMEVCSYTLEEMFCFPWPSRYERDESVMAEINNAFAQLFSQPQPKTLLPKVYNVTREAFSQDQLIVEARHDILSPLMDSNNNISGVVIGSEVKVIGRGAQPTDIPEEQRPQVLNKKHLNVVP